MANFGLRVDEIKTLRWRDIEFESGHVVLDRTGKTKRSRRVIVRSSGMLAARLTRERRNQWLDERGIGDRLEVTETVIALPNGTVVKSFRTSFDGLLDECRFVYRTIEGKHSMTSLRHTKYACPRHTNANQRTVDTATL